MNDSDQQTKRKLRTNFLEQRINERERKKERKTNGQPKYSKEINKQIDKQTNKQTKLKRPQKDKQTRDKQKQTEQHRQTNKEIFSRPRCGAYSSKYSINLNDTPQCQKKSSFRYNHYSLITISCK